MLDPLPHFIECIGLAAQAIDLSPAGNSRFDVMAPEHLADMIGEHTVVGDRMRTRPHNRHLATQDIQQLRQFIDIGLAQHPPDAGHARIVAHGLAKFIVRIVESRHAAKFQNPNGLVVEPKTRLLKQHRTSRVELDQNGNHDEQRPQNKDHRRGNDDIEGAFQEPVAQRTRTAKQFEHSEMAVASHAAASHEICQLDGQELNPHR